MTHHHNFRLLLTVSTLGAVALLAGCSTPSTPELNAKFGDSVRMARQKQTLNPAAPTGNDPVLGIDGQAAAHTQDRYHDSFKSPPSTFNVLNIGGVGSSQ